MRSKLHSIAQTFIGSVGEDLPRYTFVFPNQRAALFFRKYLSEYVTKPMFAPRVMSINECFAELSDLRVADQLTLLMRLYSEYRCLKPNAETLDIQNQGWRERYLNLCPQPYRFLPCGADSA